MVEWSPKRASIMDGPSGEWPRERGSGSQGSVRVMVGDAGGVRHDPFRNAMIARVPHRDRTLAVGRAAPCGGGNEISPFLVTVPRRVENPVPVEPFETTPLTMKAISSTSDGRSRRSSTSEPDPAARRAGPARLRNAGRFPWESPTAAGRGEAGAGRRVPVPRSRYCRGLV